MWLCFVDETGNTGSKLDDPAQPVHTLVAVMVPEDRAIGLSRAMDQIVREALHDEWPPSKLPELKGKELFARTGPWHGYSIEEVNDLYAKVVALLDEFGCEVAYARIRKQYLREWFTSREVKPQVIALQFLAERMNDYFGGQRDPLRQRGLIIADETTEHEEFSIALIADMQQFGGPVGSHKPLEHIVDTPHFVRSIDNRGVQMADLVAFVLNRTALMERPPSRSGDVFVQGLFDGVIGNRIRKYKVWPDGPPSGPK